MLRNMRSLIEKRLPVLHCDSHLKIIFRENSMKRNRNLKEMLCCSMHTKNKMKINLVIKNSEKCDICKSYLINNHTL